MGDLAMSEILEKDCEALENIFEVQNS